MVQASLSTSVLLLITAVIGFIGSIPITSKKKGGELYDQRQTGDYNIRVNLKDIHIIALLAGDYNDDEYEYDYEIPSDYTDFPVTTTPKTPSTSTSTTTTSNQSSNTPLNNNNSISPMVTIKPKPLITTNLPKTTITSTTKSRLSTYYLNSSTTTKPTTSTTTKSLPKTSTKITSTTNKPSSSTTTLTSTFSTVTPKSSLNKTLTYSYQTGLTGDRIPVIVLQQNQNQNNEAASNKAAMISSHVTIVPEDGTNEETTERVEALGEIHYKKCSNGLVRDKNGICRKLKRPPLFDISRFTSSLVSKFRRQDAVTAGRKTVNAGNH